MNAGLHSAISPFGQDKEADDEGDRGDGSGCGRLVKDLKEVGLDGLTLRAFQDAGFPDIDAYFPPPRERARQHARRARVALLYAMGIAALSIALTLIGIAAALWHMGQWIAVVLGSAVVLSAALVTIAIAHGLPPESDAEKRLKRMLAISTHRDHRTVDRMGGSIAQGRAPGGACQPAPSAVRLPHLNHTSHVFGDLVLI